MQCTLCPRECGADRSGGERGFCGSGILPRVAAAQLHHWEEPCISGMRGSGTVFFSGCSLGCAFCQNNAISRDPLRGRETDVDGLRIIFADLIEQGAHNINLVTGSHHADIIAEALSVPLPVPVIWNSSGYESLETLRLLDGKIDIYLPDFKYADNALATRFSGINDYYERAEAAVREMYRQTGKYEFCSNGLLKRGVIIRHLILPGEIQNTLAVTDRIAELFSNGEVLFSLMSQCTPNGHCPELNSSVTAEELDAAKLQLYSAKIDGYIQDLDSAANGYVPKWSD
ncbi:MAG: radical SAM protein [Oscillospiraceae bacterium]|nr:radical SAM protein [Oscillospiraceae bacterium]